MPLTPALRFEVLKALLVARERVARGTPNLQTAIYYQKLTERGWAEVDRVIDGVRFDEGTNIPGEAPGPEPKEPPVVRELREAVTTAKRNTFIPWEDPEGLTRAQCVVLLTIAFMRASDLPVVSPGPLFQHLPITSRSR
jgi:hypothetical protein